MSAGVMFVALAASLVPDLQAILDSHRHDQDVPGVSAFVTHGDKLVYSGGSGVADLETARGMTADTKLYAGSLSKILTAILVLQAAHQDRLRLDDVVPERLLPISDGNSGITYADLLTHASGVPREGNFGYWFSADFPDRDALLAYLANAEVRGPPGADFHYSNIGYAVIGLAAADAFDDTFSRALHRHVLEPLGILSSGAPGPVEGLARGYTPTGRIVPSEARPFAGVGKKIGGRFVREYHDARAMTPAFGIYTTANDLSNIARFLLGYGAEGLLPVQTRRHMLTAQPSGWGLGIKIDRFNGRAVASHSGWFAAHRAHLILDIHGKFAVGVLTNSDSGRPGVTAKALMIRMWAETAATDPDFLP